MSESNKPGDPSRASRLILVGIVFALALALDLWSKQWVWDNLRDGPPVEVIDGVFYLKYGFNTGAAFSFLRDATWARTFFIVVTFAALGYMGYLASQISTSRAYGFIAIGLIGSGAAGNLHDRFVRVDQVWDKASGQFIDKHGVVDFLQFYYPWNPEKYWPIFNVADSALVCGVALLLIYLHFHGAEIDGRGQTTDDDASAIDDAPDELPDPDSDLAHAPTEETS